VPHLHRRSAAVALALALAVTACSGSDDAGSGGTTTAATPSDVTTYLAEIADEAIIPAYQGLAEEVATLGGAVDALCAEPSAEHLAAAQDAWKPTVEAWQVARPGNLGPAMDSRLMSAVGFEVRPKSIEKLLASDDPVDVEGLDSEGASVRGLNSAEVVLFGEQRDELTGPDGARRCTYLASTVALVDDAVGEVVEAWTGGYRDTFVAGIDGDPMASVATVMNQTTHRLQELDERGLRDLVGVDDYDDLKGARQDGPAAYGLAARKALLRGVQGLIGTEGHRLVGLVADRSPDTATRLAAAATAAGTAFEPLPDSVRVAFDDHQPELSTAAEAVAALKVLVSTESASQLGVTITFSDSDGDG